eukprot:9081663-Pyramimonas_sp.AAC.1
MRRKQTHVSHGTDAALATPHLLRACAQEQRNICPPNVAEIINRPEVRSTDMRRLCADAAA